MTKSATRFDHLQHRARHEDLMKREILTPEQRHAVLIAGFAALSLEHAELEKEFATVLKEGCSGELAEDILVQMAAYLGYPKANHALAVLKKLLPQTDYDVARISDEQRYQNGIKDYAQLNPSALENINTAFGEVAGDIIQLTFQAFGDVYASSRQSLVTRQLATISALAVLGGAAPQLKFHIGASLRVGVTLEQIVEVAAWAQFLAGMPAAYNMLVELKSALAEGEGATPGYQ